MIMLILSLTTTTIEDTKHVARVKGVLDWKPEYLFWPFP